MSTNPSLNFVYESHTAGHALKPLMIIPELIEELKEHCKDKRCMPVSILEAIYDFQSNRGSLQTFNHVVIGCAKGKPCARGKGSIAYLIKHTDFAWVFGIPLLEDEYREC